MNNEVNKENDLIIENIINFVSNNKDVLEEQFWKTDRSLRRSYLKQISMKEYEDLLVKISIVVLTANAIEENMLNYSVYREQQKLQGTVDSLILEIEKPIVFKDKSIKFNAYILKLNDYYVLHLHAKNTGSYTPGGSADLVRYVAENSRLHPKCLISFGICFGHSVIDQHIGDTIIAKNLYPYFMGAKVNDGSITVKSDEFVLHVDKSDSELFDEIERLERNGYFDKSIDNNICGNVKLGDLITGEAVVSDQTFKETFEKAAGAVCPLGGEMEGYGLGKECIFYHIPYLIIKSICDWGVAKNIDDIIEEKTGVKNGKDKMQAYASMCCFTVFRKLFETNIFEKTIYHEFRNDFIDSFKAGAGCYYPYDAIIEELCKYNQNENQKAYKKITQDYIDAFCKAMEIDGVWNEIKGNEKGYIMKV